jgi:hypothetical protein
MRTRIEVVAGLKDRGCVEDQPQQDPTGAGFRFFERKIREDSFLRLVSDTAAVQFFEGSGSPAPPRFKSKI